ncbi:MAG: hypothetical protein AAGF12_42750, partial [Myxococcota bacterium]
ADAERLAATLETAQIPSLLERETGGTYRIRVAPEDVAPAVAILRDEPTAAREDEEGLFPTPASERARLRRQRADEAAGSLAKLPRVRSADLHLAVPEPPRFALRGEAPPWSATVVITHESPAPDESLIRRVTAGAFSELEAEDVDVVLVEARAAASVVPLSQVGPVAVARSSEGPLKAIAIGSLLLHILLAGGLIWVRRNSRKTGRTT